MISLHDDDNSELAGNKESEDEDCESGPKTLIQELDKNEEIGKKLIKI